MRKDMSSCSGGFPSDSLRQEPPPLGQPIRKILKSTINARDLHLSPHLGVRADSLTVKSMFILFPHGRKLDRLTSCRRATGGVENLAHDHIVLE